MLSRVKTDQLERLELVLKNGDHVVSLNHQTVVDTESFSGGCHQWLEWCAFFINRPEIPYRRCWWLLWFQLQSPWTNTVCPCQWGILGCLLVRRLFCCCTQSLRCHRKVGLCNRIRHCDVPCDAPFRPFALPWYECDAVWPFTIGFSVDLTALWLTGCRPLTERRHRRSLKLWCLADRPSFTRWGCQLSEFFLIYTVFRKNTHSHFQKLQWIYPRIDRFWQCKNYIFIAIDDVIMTSHLSG